MSRLMKKIFLISFDSFAIIGSSLISYFFLVPYIEVSVPIFIFNVGIIVIVYLVLGVYFKLFSKINRYTSIRETLAIANCVTVAFAVSVAIAVLLTRMVSLRFFALTYMFSIAAIIGSRIVWRIYHEHRYKLLHAHPFDHRIRTLVVGAGNGGSIFIRSLKHNPSELDVIGIVDDDTSKFKTLMYDVPVLGQIKDIAKLAEIYRIQQITIAIPSLEPVEYEKILDACKKADVMINLMPSVEDVLQGKVSINKFREIDVIDLLGRDEVKLDMQQISAKLNGKTILVSGAGGSIGSEICRLIARIQPKNLILLGHGEHSIYHIHQELSYTYGSQINLIPIIADVQDRKRIFEIMNEYKPDQVYHAAAHKHVPLMESNPREAVKNNIYGTKNMAEAAKEAGVGNFIMLSTDKAVKPPNVMGATKRIAEMIVTGLNEHGKTKFAAVRFGNVLGSRGSVIPLFKEQIKRGGPVTVTDYRMTRYFMTITEASRLVIQAGVLAEGGEIFILDMGKPIRIYDLAKKIIKLSGYTEDEISIIETGIRPGEKLYEELLVDSEQTDRKVFEKIFVGKVTNMSLTNVMNFVHILDDNEDSNIRTNLITFANEKFSETEERKNPFNQNKKKGRLHDLPEAVKTDY